MSKDDYFVNLFFKTSGYEITLDPYLRFNKNLFEKNKIKLNFTSSLGVDLKMNMTKRENPGVSYRLPFLFYNSNPSGILFNENSPSTIVDPVSDLEYEYYSSTSMDSTSFSSSPFYNLGLEFWVNSLCINPSLSYRIDPFINNYALENSIAVYWVLGIYDSVFLKYGKIEKNSFEMNQIQLGASITIL